MSSQFYLRQILHSFDMFAFSEHWLFEEQLDLITEFSETYQWHSISSDSNPNFLSGKLLLEFMENFTYFATNLDCQCTGPLETFSFDDGRHKSTVDYIILPKSFSHLIKASSVHLWESDNLSDHVPVDVTTELTPLSDCLENSTSAVSQSFH